MVDKKTGGKGNKVKLSVIVASRNDDHGEFLTERTNLFVDTLVRQAEKFKLDGELIIVEWNPPPDKKPLSEELSWPATPPYFPVRIITVPNELHKKYGSADKLPFFQMIAKNVGARRARAGFLLFTNIDILFSDEMVKYLATAELDKKKMYRANRHDTGAMPSMYIPVKERLELCNEEVFKVWRQQPDNKLHTPACGDFTMAAKQNIIDARGYYEFGGFSAHIDGVLCYRLVDIFGCKQETLPYPIYHIDHKDKYSIELLEEVKHNGIPLLMEYKKKATVTNEIRWGIGGTLLAEWQSPADGRVSPGLTIFTCPKSFTGKYRVAQTNAIKSWLQLKPTPEIILMGDDPGVAEAAIDMHCRHMPDIEYNKHGTPLVNSLWEQAERHGSHKKLCYVNADIILLQDWLDAILSIDLPEFLAVGRRWDWDNTEPDVLSASGLKRIAQRAKGDPDKLHSTSGIDYFAFTRGLYTDMPPFAVGRVAWDNWLANYPLTKGIPLVDITPSATAVHQNHNYGVDGELRSRDIWRSREAEANRSMTGFCWAMIEHATHRLESNELYYNEAAPYNNLKFLPRAYRPESKETVIVDGEEYPAYLNKGNAKQFIEHMATRYCIGKGLDIGAGRWPINLHHGLATPVDLDRPINDAVTLPGVEDNSQDFIFSSHCLEHLSGWKDALTRWKEVLRPGGMMFLYLPHPSFRPWNPGGAWVSGHMWKPEHDMLCEHLKSIGFEILGSNAGPDTYQSFHIAARKPISKNARVLPVTLEPREVSFVIPARNESDTNIRALGGFINGLARQASKLKIKGEIIIVEWNPPKDRKSISDAINVGKIGKAGLQVKVVTVPKTSHDIIFSDKPRNIHHYMALNVGAARAEKSKLFLIKDISGPTDVKRIVSIWDKLDRTAFWCDDNCLIIDRKKFVRARGFIELAQEDNQIRWLKELLWEIDMLLVGRGSKHIGAMRKDVYTEQPTKADKEIALTNRRRDKRAKNGPNWGMRYDALPMIDCSNEKDGTKPPPKRIAFILTAGMGDMLLSIPTVKALAKKYPDATIDWVTYEGWAELVPTKYANPVAVPFSRGLGHLEQWLQVHAKNYDEIHIAMAFQRRIINAFYNSHMMDCVAVWSGVELANRTIDVDVAEMDIEKLDLPSSFAAVCTSPCYSCNAWPTELRDKIISWIRQQGLEIVTVGGKDGREVSGALNLCGKTSPKETMAVIKKAALYIGPDNGCSWLACAVLDTPKLCFIDPKRNQIPVGFEDYTTGIIRDVTYDMPFDDIITKCKGLFTISEGISFVLSYPSKSKARRVVGQITAWIKDNNRKAEIVIVGSQKISIQSDAVSIRHVVVPNRFRECLYDNGPAWLRTGLNIGAVRAKYNNLVLITDSNKLSLKDIGGWIRDAALYKFGWVIQKESFCKARGFIETATCEAFKDLQFAQRLESIGVSVSNYQSVLSTPVVVDGDSHEGREQDAIKLFGAKNGLNWGLKYDDLDNKPIEKMLVVLTGGIGDILEGLPAISALRKKYPDAEINWLINSKCIPFVPSGITAIGVDFDRDETLLNDWLHKHGNDYDHVLILMAVHRHFSRTHYRLHMVDCIASWAGVALNKRTRSLKMDLPQVNLSEYHLPHRYVALCPNICGSCNDWPRDSRCNLAEWASENGYSTVLVGSSKRAHVIDGAHTGAIDAPLLETAAIIQGASLYIGPDTGVSWLACLTDTPKICFMGPGRNQIPIGYEGRVRGAAKDLPYSTTPEAARKVAAKMVRQPTIKKRHITIDVALIVLNGEPWLEAWLKTYRDFADRIIVVEGVDSERFDTVPDNIRQKCFTKDGHSLDNTLDILKNADADLTLITKSNGFWPSKNAMFAELSKHCNSDYVFEVDIDEFWFQKDLNSIRGLLEERPEIATWWGKPLNFWKGGRWHTKAVKGDGCWWCDAPWIFKWRPGMVLVHRPRHAEPPINDKVAYLPFRVHHYNYVMAKDAEYKRHYHKEPASWYEDVWCAWSEDNRIDLGRGVQPGRQEKTELMEYLGKHPKFAQRVLTKIEKGI